MNLLSWRVAPVDFVAGEGRAGIEPSVIVDGNIAVENILDNVLTCHKMCFLIKGIQNRNTENLSDIDESLMQVMFI